MNEWYKLKLVGLSDTLLLKLMKEFVSIKKLYEFDEKLLAENYHLDKEKIEKIYTSIDINLDEELERNEKYRVKVLSYTDDKYPYLLKNIQDPPPFLYVKGNKSFLDRSIGVVGTRKMTREGKGACEYIVRNLVNSGVTIVSGLALGIDTCSHMETLKQKGNLIGVVGNGLDIIYPPSNKNLYDKVEEEGLLISELPLGQEPARWTFPRRNRIIAGLSRGVLVAESYKDGGSLITAKIALEEGRDVFAIPGMINYPSFEGCNNLIKRGEAKLVSRVEDILEEYDWTVNKKEVNKKFDSLDEEIIYNELITPKSLDELILKTKTKAPDLLVILTNMELEGLIKSLSGGRFGRNE